MHLKVDNGNSRFHPRAQLNAISEELTTRGQQQAAEAESTLSKIRQAAAEVGVAQHAVHFKEESVSHNQMAKWWLVATGLISFIAICWGILSFKFSTIALSNPPKTVEIVESFASRIIVLTILYYILIWCAKNYGAHRHNVVVNKHRQNALSTFETFVKAAGDDIDIKNAVLLQATHSIFSSQSSGYNSKENDQESPNKIIEIMRNVSSVSKSSS